MRRWGVRILVPALATAGALTVLSGPAFAGWVSGGVYTLQSKCISVGQSRVSSGIYQTYVCEPQSPGWLLRGFVN
ncbi:hypothetical protein [Micromonospora sp. RP3T]|uniref:hypothetical protein n=1 Tax=Micromonospora sp. RP3T TaxID=2135446 RepID=UPI000D15AF19|nr:hypothetical protein [Micromonospora sp. RP3T]PTA45234.1 hypothetical protein C8054_15560 [Micromonospora sp. RP3T]